MNSAEKSLRGKPIVVLGAGRGKRMGGPKALMQVDNKPWWVWQDERLVDLGLQSHWVVSDLVHSEMKCSGCAPERAVIADGSSPMFASVLAGIASVADLSAGVFLLPVDTPVPNVLHFRRLLGSSVPAHPTFKGNGGHPLFLPGQWIEREMGAFISDVRAGKEHTNACDLRLDRLIEGSSHRIETDDPGVVVNINEPADLKAWIAVRGVR